VRILFINTLYSPDLFGGAERVMQTQAEALAEAGHDVAVLALSSASGVSHSKLNGVRVWRAGIRNLYSPADELKRHRHGRVSHFLWHAVDSYNPLMKETVEEVLRVFKPQVASCHNLPGWSIAAWDVLAAQRIPIVQVLHDQYLLCPTSMMFRGGQRCAGQCMPCRVLRMPHRDKSTQVDSLVGVSSFITRKLIAQGYFDGVRSIRTIHNIRDTLEEGIPKLPRPRDGKIVFGYIGRLCEPKGLELLLDAFTSASDQNWMLVVAGSGEAGYEARLRSKFAHSRIEFAGHVTPREFFPGVDFTIVPSIWEDTLPSVVFESLLYGRPVLGSDLGGIPEMLNDENGLLFGAGDRESLVQRMQEAADGIGKFQDRFKAIQQGASGYCDKGKWTERWMEVYRDAVACSR
jgi:glycosyltransferase involved in cell wall biosynthesis